MGRAGVSNHASFVISPIPSARFGGPVRANVRGGPAPAVASNATGSEGGQSLQDGSAMLPPGFFGFGHNVLQSLIPALTREVYEPLSISIGYHLEIAGARTLDQQLYRGLRRPPRVDQHQL